MSFLFGSPSTPSVSYRSVPPPPSEPVVRKEETAKVRKGATGRKTLLTGPRGLLEPAPVSKKTLLGE